jgi:hypothetical protein
VHYKNAIVQGVAPEHGGDLRGSKRNLELGANAFSVRKLGGAETRAVEDGVVLDRG